MIWRYIKTTLVILWLYDVIVLNVAAVCSSIQEGVLRRLGAATTQYVAVKPASIAQNSATKAGSAFRDDFFGARAAATVAAARRWLRSASLSRFNYLTLKADRPRRAAGGALRLVRRVRSGRTRRQRAAVRLPRNAPDSAAPQRHIAHRAHATLKFRNRRLSRVQLAMSIWPNSVESDLQTRRLGPEPPRPPTTASTPP